MKSPFAILVVVVILLGVGVGIAAIVFLGPSDSDSTDTIPVVSDAELPTPSARNEVLSRDSSQETTRSEPSESSEVPVTSIPSDDAAEQSSNQNTTAQSLTADGNTQDEAGNESAFAGRAGGPGGGGGFQAIQEAIAENPELAELFQKAQTGNITEADQARMQELMEEVLSEAGIGIPGGMQGGGLGVAPTQGTITAIAESALTIEHSDDSGISTNVVISPDTSFDIVRELEVADLESGNNVVGSVQRREGGRIFIVNLTLLPEQSGRGQGFGGGFVGAGNDDSGTGISNINGTVAEINDQTVNVETTQGTLRLTADEDTTITSMSAGSISDLSEGMAVIAIGSMEGDTLQARNVIAGPASILTEGDGRGGLQRGPR